MVPVQSENEGFIFCYLKDRVQPKMSSPMTITCTQKFEVLWITIFKIPWKTITEAIFCCHKCCIIKIIVLFNTDSEYRIFLCFTMINLITLIHKSNMSDRMLFLLKKTCYFRFPCYEKLLWVWGSYHNHCCVNLIMINLIF